MPPARDLCGYVLRRRRFGRIRFCDRPAAPGASLCATHRARCTLALDRAAGDRRVARRLAIAERELAWLGAPLLIESFDETDDERLSGLDLMIEPDRDVDIDNNR